MQGQCLPSCMSMLLIERMRVYQHHAVHHVHVGKEHDCPIIGGKHAQQADRPDTYVTGNILHPFNLPDQPVSLFIANKQTDILKMKIKSK